MVVRASFFITSCRVDGVFMITVRNTGAAAARFGVKVGERVWRVNGRAVGEALSFANVIDLCRRRPVALDLVDAEA